jgi:hypothetical protein
MGRTVLAGRLNGERALLQLDGLASGTYVVRLLDGSGRSVRVVKQ